MPLPSIIGERGPYYHSTGVCLGTCNLHQIKVEIVPSFSFGTMEQFSDDLGLLSTNGTSYKFVGIFLNHVRIKGDDSTTVQVQVSNI